MEGPCSGASPGHRVSPQLSCPSLALLVPSGRRPTPRGFWSESAPCHAAQAALRSCFSLSLLFRTGRDNSSPARSLWEGVRPAWVCSGITDIPLLSLTGPSLAP